MCVYISIYGEIYVDMYTYLCNCILTKKNNIFTFINIQKLIQQIYMLSCHWNSGIGATIMVMNKTKVFQKNEVAVRHETLSKKTTFIFQQGMW